MKRIFLAVILCSLFVSVGFAQTGDDAPASKEDVQRYLDAIHARDMMKLMMVAMAKPMHKMVHDELLKNREKLPPDFEARMNKSMDQMMNQLPMDDLLNAMIPAYQKHFTKGDIDALVAFYSAPTGQKLLRETPAVMADYMESVQPIMLRSIDKMSGRLQDQIAQMKKDPAPKPATPDQN